MRRNDFCYLLTAWATVLAIGAWSSIVMAQSQVVGANSGHALDANPGLNSGGQNQKAAPIPYGQLGNDIVQNNVTRGGFNGGGPNQDWTTFHGNTPAASNALGNFIRTSQGIPSAFAPPPPVNPMLPAYTEQQWVAPPSGFTETSNNPVYTPAAQKVNSLGDARLGAPIINNAAIMMPAPGEMLMPGPVDPTSQLPSIVTASPLYGIRQWNQNDLLDQQFLQRFDQMHLNALNTSQLDPRVVAKLRQELQGSAFNQLNPAQPMGTAPNAMANPTNSRGPALGGQPLNSELPTAFENPANAYVAPQPQKPALGANATGNLNTAQSSVSRSMQLPPPGRQSSQYAELKSRLERYYVDRQADLDRVMKNTVHQSQSTQSSGGEISPSTVTPGGNASGSPHSGIVDYGQKAHDILANVGKPTGIKTPKPQPLVISSISEGFTSRGMTELLKVAEDLARQGKFSAAIDKYDAIEQVIPNNPMVLIGRANAEIGSAYYGRAENHLKAAFAADAALLMAKFDLKAMLGDERLAATIKDLKEVAAADERIPTAPFLLAYIAYNTGDERRAAGYLDLADKRSRGKDHVISLIREHWSLPVENEAAPATQPK